MRTDTPRAAELREEARAALAACRLGRRNPVRQPEVIEAIREMIEAGPPASRTGAILRRLRERFGLTVSRGQLNSALAKERIARPRPTPYGIGFPTWD